MFAIEIEIYFHVALLCLFVCLLVTKCVNKLLNRPRREDRIDKKKQSFSHLLTFDTLFFFFFSYNNKTRKKRMSTKLVIVGGLGGAFDDPRII